MFYKKKYISIKTLLLTTRSVHAWLGLERVSHTPTHAGVTVNASPSPGHEPAVAGLTARAPLCPHRPRGTSLLVAGFHLLEDSGAPEVAHVAVDALAVPGVHSAAASDGARAEGGPLAEVGAELLVAHLEVRGHALASLVTGLKEKDIVNLIICFS